MASHRISIGPVALGEVPRIAAVVDRKVAPGAISKLGAKGVSLLEFRFDLMPTDFQEALEYASSVKRNSPFGLIGTLRENRKNRSRRFEFFERILPVVDAIDVEVEWEKSPELIALAKTKTIIVSHHDFKRTPLKKKMHEIAGRCAALGAHIVKIAAMAEDEKDVTDLLAFAEECPHPVVAVAMGPLGAATRVMAPLFGSLFSYAYIGDKPVAPGQLNVDQMLAQFRLFYPGFGK